MFGLLKIYPVKRLVAMLHRLIESGLARQRDPDRNFRPIIELTSRGAAVMKGEQCAAGLVDRSAAAGIFIKRDQLRVRSEKLAGDELSEQQFDPEVMSRFDRLRAARMELARDRQLPPYCICHDRTLKLIAQYAPRDVETLEQIKGMGPHKVKMYGDASWRR